MADKTTTVLRLVFDTETVGKQYSISFRNPKNIVSRDFINSSGGALTALADGGIVDTTFTDLVP
ncbi:MAG: hypothetical protein NTV33_13450 [Coprothermobacterota bacterium]|nr:hypothetical protein [Coprothermobacterota bacterium]